MGPLARVIRHLAGLPSLFLRPPSQSWLVIWSSTEVNDISFFEEKTFSILVALFFSIVLLFIDTTLCKCPTHHCNMVEKVNYTIIRYHFIFVPWDLSAPLIVSLSSTEECEHQLTLNSTLVLTSPSEHA